MRSILFIAVAALVGICEAQVGFVDPGFVPTDPTGGGSNGLNGPSRTIAIQPDGKILVAGNFTTVNGVPRPGIARMEPSGALDLSFDPGFGPNDLVRAIAVQEDGRILVGGMFTYFNGVWCNRLVRLAPDGSVDPGFSTGMGFDGNVYTLSVLPDGRILVGGDFFNLNNVISRGMVRLMPDGTQDASFDAGGVPIVYSIAQRPDGRLVIGGQFSYVHGMDRRCIAGLMPDGSLDMVFNPAGWNFSPVLTLAVQPDGKVLAGGMIPGGIARLESNGEFDPSFGSGVGGFTGWDPWVYALDLRPDGKIICAGRFTHYNGVARNGAARLFPDGTLDETFNIGQGFNGEVRAMAVQHDGKPVMGGYFVTVNGVARNYIARLLVEGWDVGIADELVSPALEMYPNPGDGRFFIRTETAGDARLSVIGPDGRSVDVPFVPLPRDGAISADLGQCAKGLYVVRLEQQGWIRTGRLVVL